MTVFYCSVLLIFTLGTNYESVDGVMVKAPPKNGIVFYVPFFWNRHQEVLELTPQLIARDIIANNVLFLPLGVLVALNRNAKLLVLPVLLSLTIEVLQATVVYGRTADINDLIFNTTGTVVSYLIAKNIIKNSQKRLNKKNNADTKVAT